MSGMKRKTAIAAGVVWLLAVFLGLWFMGVLSLGEKSISKTEGEEIAAGGIDEKERVWEIVFLGMKFTIPQKGIALVHESGCLNIRQNDHYLIQILIEDETIDDKWEHMEQKRESLIESGYRMEKEAERLTDNERDCIRYVISMGQERGSAYDRSYFAVMLAPTDDGRHFLAVIRYDGLDVERMDEATRDKVYEEAFADAEAVLDAAHSTDEREDEVGSYWMEDKNLGPEPYMTEDTIIYGDGQYRISYHLPDYCQLIADDISGKRYLDTVNLVYISTDVLHYTWKSAKDMAKSFAESELSRIDTEGEVTVNDRVFYYYTYSVLEYAKNKTETLYYFHAYCDLDDGSIYTIYGRAENYPAAFKETYYLDWMDIREY